MKQIRLLLYYMKYLKDSIFKYKGLIQGKEWYHQRFDGCPMFIFAIADAEMVKEKRKPAGNYPNVRVCFFGDGKADWHLDMRDVRSATAALITLAKKDKNLSTKLLKAWKKDELDFDRFFWKEFPKISLRALTDRQLLALWKRYYKLAIARLSSTGIIDHFALGSDALIQDMVKDEVRKLTNNRPMKDSEFAGIFAVSTAPVHQSFINQAEIDLLKIATGQSTETLQHYQKRYFWIKNNYVTSQVLSVEYFQNEVKTWKQSGKDLRVEITKLENTPKENKKKKTKLFKQYRFSPLLKTLLKISEDFTFWQDERKRATYFNIYIGCTLLEEISRRTGYMLDQLKYVTASEIEGVMKDKKPLPRQLDARMAGSVFLVNRRGYCVATGKDVEKVRTVMWGKQKQDEVNDFRGLTASLGKVQGRVRIVKSVTEIGKVEQGDILVAVMTRPDYVPAMKKAAAIVTNEGGITSHAAIVSRELGIPCVIGTKIATEVLHDGDIVEVNANHGKVTIIKRV